MDEKKSPDTLPGNHGQFGANDATEDYKPLPDHDAGGSPAAPDAATPGTKSGPSNPGPNQVQGGMRS
jgi:hypothetical protein